MSNDPRCRKAIEVHCGSEVIERCDRWDATLADIEKWTEKVTSKVVTEVDARFSAKPWLVEGARTIVIGRAIQRAKVPEIEAPDVKFSYQDARSMGVQIGDVAVLRRPADSL